MRPVDRSSRQDRCVRNGVCEIAASRTMQRLLTTQSNYCSPASVAKRYLQLRSMGSLETVSAISNNGGTDGALGGMAPLSPDQAQQPDKDDDDDDDDEEKPS